MLLRWLLPMVYRCGNDLLDQRIRLRCSRELSPSLKSLVYSHGEVIVFPVGLGLGGRWHIVGRVDRLLDGDLNRNRFAISIFMIVDWERSRGVSTPE